MLYIDNILTQIAYSGKKIFKMICQEQREQICQLCLSAPCCKDSYEFLQYILSL